MEITPIIQFLHRSGFFGLGGSLLILAVVGVTAAFYMGKEKERYSILNHFISELGEIGVSRLASLFNGALSAGGLLFVPFLIGLGIRLGNVWGLLGLCAGLGASGAIVALGILPMNKLAPHTKTSGVFFWLGLVTIVFFTIAIFTQPGGALAVPLTVNIFSGLAFLAYAGFLGLGAYLYFTGEKRDIYSPATLPSRPRIWPLAMLEWGVLFATLLWFMGVAVLARV
jgi:hypothetical protein